MIRKLASKGTPGVWYAKIDVQKHGELAHESGVSSIPDTQIYHNGRKASFVGTENASSTEKILSQHRSRLVPTESTVPTSGTESAPVVPATVSPAERTIAPEGAAPLPPGIQKIPAS